MDKGSCHQNVRQRRSRRHSAEPLSTIILKDAPCSLMSWHSTSPSFSITFFVPLCHSGITECSSGPGHDLICQMFIVVRNGPGVVFNLSFCVCGVVMCTGTSFAFCSSGESPPAFNHSSKYALCKVSPVGIQNTYSLSLSVAHFLFLGAGVAPLLPPCSRKLLDETVKTCCFSFVVSLSRW